MHSSVPAVLSAGIDYVTVTARQGPKFGPLLAFGQALVGDEVVRGNKPRVVGGHGYVGHGAGHAAWGHRAADVLVTLSGECARLYGLAALDLADHAARLDLQTTVILPNLTPEECIKAARYAPEGRAGRGRPIRRRLLDDTELGVTCYLGSPKSQQIGRIYDKHRESSGEWPKGATRFEVQMRKGHAEVWRQVAAVNALDAATVHAGVGEWFGARGVPHLANSEAVWPGFPAPTATTDYGRTLQWWRSCVAPSVRRWWSYERRVEVMIALGVLDG
jgi:hypothetical protein